VDLAAEDLESAYRRLVLGDREHDDRDQRDGDRDVDKAQTDGPLRDSLPAFGPFGVIDLL